MSCIVEEFRKNEQSESLIEEFEESKYIASGG